MPPPPGTSIRSSALNALMADIAAILGKSRNPGNDDNSTATTEGNKGADSTDRNDTKAKEFRLALARYASGEETDVVKFYDEVEAVISLALVEGEGEEEARYARMVDVLSCVEGETAVTFYRLSTVESNGLEHTDHTSDR